MMNPATSACLGVPSESAGCDDYDTKPVELPRLLEKIERLLGG